MGLSSLLPPVCTVPVQRNLQVHQGRGRLRDLADHSEELPVLSLPALHLSGHAIQLDLVRRGEGAQVPWSQQGGPDGESRRTGTNSPLLVSPSRSPNPSTSLVEEERGKILSYGEVMLRSLAGRQEQVDRTLLTDLLQVSVHGTSLSTKTAQQVSSLLDRRTLAGLAALPEFQGLPTAAQAQVVEHNLPLVHRFRQAVCLSNPELTWRRLIGFLVGEEKLQSCEEDLPCDLSGKKSPGSTMMYSSLLQSHLATSSPSLATARLAKTLMVPAIARQVHQLARERLII